MASTDARPVPIRATAYRVSFAIYDADGDLVTGATGLDSEVSKDFGTYADCTNEATEIATSSGTYYLDITSTEMTADNVSIIVKTTSSGAKTTFLSFYPQDTGDIKVDLQTIAAVAVSASTAQLGVNVVNFGGSPGTFASGIPSASVTTSSINAIADQVWDEAASGHTASGSYGQALNIVRAGTAQAGASTTITLDASASAIDNFYSNQKIFVTGGTGANQGRIISSYVGATKVATVATWGTNPDATSVFVIVPFGSIPGATAPTAAEVADAVWDEATSGHTSSGSYGQGAGGVVINTGTAQAGTTSSITLAAGASSTDDRYNFNQVIVLSGTGNGQSRQITDYVGSTRVATIAPAFAIAPDNTSVYMVTPFGVDAATVAAIADAIWDEQRSGHIQSGSFGEYTFSDAVRISGDSGAADNAESFFDGTGYAGTNNVIPTVTTITNTINANAVQISGDTTAADNAESFFDGTGYAGTNNVIPSVTTVTGNVNGNVSGNVTGSVGSIASGGITAASIAAATLSASKFSGNILVDVKAINGTTVVGNGSSTPWGP